MRVEEITGGRNAYDKNDCCNEKIGGEMSKKSECDKKIAALEQDKRNLRADSFNWSQKYFAACKYAHNEISLQKDRIIWLEKKLKIKDKTYAKNKKREK